MLERKQDDLKKSWVPARAETGQAGIELDDAFKAKDNEVRANELVEDEFLEVTSRS